MMSDLQRMILTDKTGRPVGLADKFGLCPVYFTEKTRPSPRPHWKDLIELSRRMWGYHNYTGYITPWHDSSDPTKMLIFQEKSIRAWLWECGDMDVHWKTYCVLSFALSDYMMWERPALLLFQRTHLSWIKSLRGYVPSRKRMDDIAFFLLEFLRLQVETYGRASIERSSLTGIDFKDTKSYKSRSKAVKNVGDRKRKSAKKKLVLYEMISDRLSFLEHNKVDFYDWIGEKFRTIMSKLGPNHQVSLAMLVNANAFDPDLSKLYAKLSDPWRALREFLGLKPECEFPDGSIPKGWQPASDDVEADRKRIVRVTADGYYYYEDGTQRRGLRHYASNKYLTIRCTPANFLFFKESWHDPRLLSGNPTWLEYSEHGLHPGIWDENGANVSTQYKALKNVRWRRG